MSQKEQKMKEEKDLVRVEEVFSAEDMAIALEEDLAETKVMNILLTMIVMGLSFIVMMLV